MTEYTTIAVAVITGAAALIGIWVTYRFQKKASDRDRDIAWKKERRDELTNLYAKALSLIDEVTSRQYYGEAFDRASEVSETTAKLRLLAPADVVELYSTTMENLEAWRELHVKTLPEKWDTPMGRMTILKAPDPTAQYKQPAKDAYHAFRASLSALTASMKKKTVLKIARNANAVPSSSMLHPEAAQGY